MIITKSPLRITLGGGGTDLPSYYSEYEGFLISAAINKYVYITINDNFVNELWLKYSKIEHTTNIDTIQHPIFREAIKLVTPSSLSIDINSIADIPAGTGLGSSGSFTTALLKALHTHKHDIITTRDLAEEACDIEINKLGEHVGKQDQYIAAYGGLKCMTFHTDGFVEVKPLEITNENLYNLEDNLIMYFTGYSHSASSILNEQDQKSKNGDIDMLTNLHYVKQIGYDSKYALEHGKLDDFACLMNMQQILKNKRSKNMSNPQIDEWYEYGLKNGALGGKLIGAGGGGFLLFYSENKTKLREAMSKITLQEVRFHFDSQGTRVVK